MVDERIVTRRVALRANIAPLSSVSSNTPTGMRINIYLTPATHLVRYCKRLATFCGSYVFRLGHGNSLDRVAAMQVRLHF